MPNIDQVAKALEMELAGRVGAAVQARRKALKLTAKDLAERTAELGYPITRVSISKIETNSRAGKLDVAELLVLAVALEIPPALLLFPDYPDGTVELLPGREADVKGSVAWLSGSSVLPSEIRPDGTIEPSIEPSNEGVELVRAVSRLAALDRELMHSQLMMHPDYHYPYPTPTDELIESVKRRTHDIEQQFPAVKKEISQARSALWGTAEDNADG